MKGIFTHTILHDLYRGSETESRPQGVSGFWHRSIHHLLWDLIPTLLILASVSWITLEAASRMDIDDYARSAGMDSQDPPRQPG